ncbi:MAG: hypothetical protein Q9167_003041 [Letrouitia subvulpina]
MGSINDSNFGHEAPLPPETTSLLEAVINKGENLHSGDPNARHELLEASRALYLSLQTPIEAILNIAWAYSALYSVLRVAGDIDLFRKLTENHGKAKTSSELASLTGTDLSWLSRMLKHLAAMRVLKEVDSETYAPTPLVETLAVEKYHDTMFFVYDVAQPAIYQIPEYFRKKGYESPRDGADGIFQYGQQTNDSFFKWIAARPQLQKAFDNHIAGHRAGHIGWMHPTFYPVDAKLAKGFKASKNEALIVDVGGSLGHDILEFYTMFPHLPGRLILQEQPQVLRQAKANGLPQKIELMTHNFFEPQPVKGARAYYMHRILHDWPDDKCRDILRNQMPAMEKGYSRLLLNENVIPATGANWKITSLDMIMMTVLASTERTEQHWKELLGSVGLKVTNIYSCEVGGESLIEAELT